MFERKLMTTSLAVLAATAAVATVGAVPDTKAPRIVSAVMVDANGNGHADAVKLTYSERVRHARDRDGKYPFRIGGYRIRFVDKARGRTILLALVEQAAADDSARPAIAYRRTRAGSVTDRARNQAQAQVFRATKAHGRKPAEPTPQPQPQPEPSPVTDRDGDGTPDAQDCAPNDPKIHPKAQDLPDLAFVDSNCDGIDGTVEDAIFVSPEGKDTSRGTKAAPKREIRAAVAAALATDRDVYVAAGTYGRIELITSLRRVRIYGGYDPKTWKRGSDARTLITGAPEGIFANGARDVLLQHLTAQGITSSASRTAYGIRAIGGSQLALQRVVVRALDGVDGPSGSRGDDGRRGGNGGHGAKGKCDETSYSAGGAGGSSFAGAAFAGGRGGAGGTYPDFHTPVPGERGQDAPAGASGGVGGASGKPGKPGGPGARGASGDIGLNGVGGVSSLASAGPVWEGARGTAGVSGAHGTGGGGGGGGGGQGGLFVDAGRGNGGGGGGGGGEGGAGGQAGLAGGGSFGVYLHDSAVTVSDGSSIQAGNGGKGGRGGDGGEGGPGGDPGKAWVYCTDEIGAGGFGGAGGKGGRGGGGGGGTGGPSIGVMQLGSSKATLADTSIKVGTPGAAGAAGVGGSGGMPAQPGIARPVFPGP